MINPSKILGFKNSRNLVLVLVLMLASVAKSEAAGVIALGDSLTAGLTNNGGNTRTCLALDGIFIAADEQRKCIGGGRLNKGGWQPFLAQLTDLDIYNFGNTDETSDEILSRSARNIASRNSEIVLILAGTNDVIRRVPKATIVQNLKRIVDNAIAAGQRPIIGTIPPLSGSRFANRNADVIALNEEIKTFDNADVADIYQALIGNWSANTSGDFIHLGTNGNRVVAETWSEALVAIEPPAAKPKSSLAPILDLLLNEED